MTYLSEYKKNENKKTNLCWFSRRHRWQCFYEFVRNIRQIMDDHHWWWIGLYWPKVQLKTLLSDMDWNASAGRLRLVLNVTWFGCWTPNRLPLMRVAWIRRVKLSILDYLTESAASIVVRKFCLNWTSVLFSYSRFDSELDGNGVLIVLRYIIVCGGRLVWMPRK